MPDPVDPILPPPAPNPSPEPAERSTSTGLPSNVAAALACIPLVGGIIFYILEKHDGFVRFYAMQSIIFGVVWILFGIASGILEGFFRAVPGIAFLLVALWNLLSWLIYLALFVLMVVTMVKAFNEQLWELPYIGPMARKQTSKT